MIGARLNWVPVGTRGGGGADWHFKVPTSTPNFGSTPCTFPMRFLCFLVFEKYFIPL